MAALQRHQETFGSFGANINAHTQRHLRALRYICVCVYIYIYIYIYLHIYIYAIYSK